MTTLKYVFSCQSTKYQKLLLVLSLVVFENSKKSCHGAFERFSETIANLATLTVTKHQKSFVNLR